MSHDGDAGDNGTDLPTGDAAACSEFCFFPH